MREEIVDIATADGPMETFICRPERGGPCPPVFFLMDAPGIRDELHDMARRLATVGYFVMLPNLYYRAGRDTRYGPDVLDPASPDHKRMRSVRTRMTIPPVMEDVGVLLDYAASKEDAADGPAGTLGERAGYGPFRSCFQRGNTRAPPVFEFQPLNARTTA